VQRRGAVAAAAAAAAAQRRAAVAAAAMAAAAAAAAAVAEMPGCESRSNKLCYSSRVVGYSTEACIKREPSYVN
jgi:hypothetical protein